MSAVVLVVDDDPVQRRLVERHGHPLRLPGADGGQRRCRPPPPHRTPQTHRRLPGARPGDARSRRARRHGAHARGRPRYPGDRADRPRRHRQCGLGDARRRLRFRGQAGEPRAAAGLLAQCARQQGAGRRTAPPAPQPRRHPDHGRRRHPLGGDAQGARRGGKGRRLQYPGADRRRIRRRQGHDRARHPRLAARARPNPSSPSIAAPCRKTLSSRFCSATRKAPSPAPPKSTPASSSRPTAARCSSTRSANCRWRRRSNCCARCRRARSSRSGRAARSRSTCASSRRPTAI